MPRGLRPLPHQVCRIVAEFDVDGRAASCSWCAFVPGAVVPDYSTAESIADAFLLAAAPAFMAMCSKAAACVACNVSFGPATFARARVQTEPIQGAWDGAQGMGLVCGLRWLGSVTGRGTVAHTFIPSCPDQFIADGWRLSASGYANLRDDGATFLNAFNAIPSPYGGHLVHGVLHQIRSGVVLVPPLLDPTIGLEPMPRIGTMSRRLPKGRQISPS